MKNWNTGKFNSKSDEEIWKLSQLINYGLDGQKLSIQKVKSVWKKLEPFLDLERARMIKYLIWESPFSPLTNKNYWGLSPKTAL
ncbi:MAG: hypothetical protein AAB656_00110 [Patescibacteria group bacterium]